MDGTTNFIHGYPVFSVSIALEFRGELLLGVIFDPCREEIFTAQRGRGVFLNGLRMNMSAVGNMGDSLIMTGFPFRRKEVIDTYLNLFKKIFLRVSDIRRAGSAALDLAGLACGRCEGFFEVGLSPWDIAAGSIMIEEAGGIITDFSGGKEYLETGNIVAGTPLIHKELMCHVREAFADIIPK